MTNKTLEKMIDRRVKKIKVLLDHIWENRKEILDKQRRSLTFDDEANFHPSFHDAPELYLPHEIYRTLTTDAADKINEMLSAVVEENGKLLKTDLLDWFFPEDF